MTLFTVKKKLTGDRPVMGVYTNILRQVNAKCKKDLYHISFKQDIMNMHPMVIGVDVVNAGRKSIVGMTATYTQSLTQHLGRIEY